MGNQCCGSSGPLLQVIDGVHLPLDEPATKRVAKVLDLNIQTNVPVIQFALEGVGNLENQPKTGEFDSAQKALRDVMKISVPERPNYKYFGSKNYETLLCLLAKTNPFWASALTFKHGSFELKAYDPEETNKSLYQKMMETMHGAGHKVNVKFDDRLTKITSIQVFDDLEGQELTAATDKNRYASAVLYNMVFYASAVHATMHVFHLIMTSAFAVASTGFDPLNKLAEMYDGNVPVKYVEVGLLLVGDVDNTSAIITGRNGFGSSQAIRPILKELFVSWASCKTADAFLNNFLLAKIPHHKRDTVLVEFKKHSSLIENFAGGLATAVSELDVTKFKKTESNLKQYLSKCGDDFEFATDSLKSWFEIMSVTGIMHGTTLSYSRLIAVPDVLRWRNVLFDTWDSNDKNLLSTGLGTIVGMEQDRYVMSSKPDKISFHPKIQVVLESFDAKASALKEAYKNELLERPDVDDVGFVLSDYCTDGFDGKQLTIATYI